MEEKRIYAVVAETVWTPEKGEVVQIAGRMAAQACHVVSRMRMHRMLHEAVRLIKKVAFMLTRLRLLADEEITTIILSCRDNREMEHVHRLLTSAHIKHYDFEDSNEPVYGSGKFRTALSTVPVTPDQVEGILDYLPLWRPKA